MNAVNGGSSVEWHFSVALLVFDFIWCEPLGEGAHAYGRSSNIKQQVLELAKSPRISQLSVLPGLCETGIDSVLGS